MSRASGLVLILGGLAVAAYVVPPDDAGEAEAPGQRTDVAKSAPIPQQVASAERTVVVVRPGPPAHTPASVAQSAPPAPVADRASARSAPVVVTIAPRTDEPSWPPRQRVVIPKGAEALTRELQKELRRVGCYDGEINGAWTQSTRRAMKAFTDRLNASLPVDAPDPVLYALVQGQHEEVCGKACPTGQALSEAGRCLPTAIIARSRPTAPPAGETITARPAPGPAIVGWSTTTTAAAPALVPTVPTTPREPLGAPPTEGRMALAGPTTETPPTADPQAAEPPRGAPKPAPSYSGRREPVGWARRTLARQYSDSQN
jgi:hypothetical protein